MNTAKKLLVGLVLLLASLGAGGQGIWQPTWLNPGPIGCGGTPAAGCFTTLDASSTFTLGADVVLVRDAANAFAQRNSTNAQTFRVYNTFTDGSNYERAYIRWNANVLELGAEGAGSGTQRIVAIDGSQLNLRSAGNNRWILNSSGNITASADNANDIGAAGASRPRSIYTATDVSAPKFRARGGTTPTIGSCGTSPGIAGNDSAMRITVGTGGVATSCGVTFSSTWTTAPVCIAQNNTDRVAYSIVTNATQLTITATAAFTASSLFHVICMGVA